MSNHNDGHTYEERPIALELVAASLSMRKLAWRLSRSSGEQPNAEQAVQVSGDMHMTNHKDEEPYQKQEVQVDSERLKKFKAGKKTGDDSERLKKFKAGKKTGDDDKPVYRAVGPCPICEGRMQGETTGELYYEEYDFAPESATSKVGKKKKEKSVDIRLYCVCRESHGGKRGCGAELLLTYKPHNQSMTGSSEFDLGDGFTEMKTGDTTWGDNYPRVDGKLENDLLLPRDIEAHDFLLEKDDKMLEDIRTRARNWNATASALTGVFGIVLVVSDKNAFAELEEMPKIWAAFFMALAFLVYIVSIFLLFNSAYGSLNEIKKIQTNQIKGLALRLKKARQADAEEALWKLRTALSLTVVTLCFLAVAIGISWFGEKKVTSSS